MISSLPYGISSLNQSITKLHDTLSKVERTMVLSETWVSDDDDRITFYRTQRSCGQGNVFTGVCLSTGGGICLSACWDAIPPPGTRQTPPGPGRPPPGSRLQHTVYKRPVRILLECILVYFHFC